MTGSWLQALRRASKNWARDSIMNGLLASPLVPSEVRWRFCRLFGMRVSRSRISAHCWFGGTKVAIGTGSFVSFYGLFDCSAPITIGSRCSVGPRVSFLTSSHEIGERVQRAGSATSSPIVVGDGTWIGANVVILPGVSIGPGCVVGAGSVVVSDCDADGLYAGIPARRVRDL